MPEHQQTQKSTESKSSVQKPAPPRIQAPSSHPMAIIQRARVNPKSLTPADILQLQRTIGNRAVGRLLSEIRSSSTAQKAPVQRQEIPEEEEPLQGKFERGPEKETCPSCMQRQEIPEEEEPLQGKMIGIIQRQEIPEEEEPLQGKFENKPEITCPSCFAVPLVQRQEIPEEEETLQGKFESIQRQEIPEEEEPLQTKRENNTGMPDNLKAGVESLSGIDMSDVKVHYNSSKPAEVDALAYTQGTNIHIAPGQERHLPHEAWHVVQQAQGRVKPTMQLKDGVPVNDDEWLEHEADVMGVKALQKMRGDQIVTSSIFLQRRNRSASPLQSSQHGSPVDLVNVSYCHLGKLDPVPMNQAGPGLFGIVQTKAPETTSDAKFVQQLTQVASIENIPLSSSLSSSALCTHSGECSSSPIYGKIAADPMPQMRLLSPDPRITRSDHVIQCGPPIEKEQISVVSTLKSEKGEYEKDKTEIQKIFKSLKKYGADNKPLSKMKYLYNRWDNYLPKLDHFFLVSNSIVAKGLNSVALRKLTRLLNWYLLSGDGKYVIMLTLKDLRKSKQEVESYDRESIKRERNDLVQITDSDEKFFVYYLKQPKPTVIVYRGDGRGVKKDFLDNYKIHNVSAQGNTDITFHGVVQHTHSNVYKNGMVSTTLDRNLAKETYAMSNGNNNFGVLYEFRLTNYIDIADLLLKRNFKNRYPGQREILVPGDIAAGNIVSVTLYSSKEGLINSVHF